MDKVTPDSGKNFFNYFRVPSELIVNIFNRLPLTSLISAMRSCKHFYIIGQDKRIWKKFYNKERNPNDKMVLESGKGLNFYKTVSDFHNFGCLVKKWGFSRHKYPDSPVNCKNMGLQSIDVETIGDIELGFLTSLPQHLILIDILEKHIKFFDLQAKRELIIEKRLELISQCYDRFLCPETREGEEVTKVIVYDLHQNQSYSESVRIVFDIENPDKFKNENEMASSFSIDKSNRVLCRGIDLRYEKTDSGSVVLSLKQKKDDYFHLSKEIKIDFLCNYRLEIDFKSGFICFLVAEENRTTKQEKSSMSIYELTTGKVLPGAEDCWEWFTEMETPQLENLVAILKKEKINADDFPDLGISDHFLVVPNRESRLVNVYNLEQKDSACFSYVHESKNMDDFSIKAMVMRGHLLVTLCIDTIHVCDMQTGEKLHQITDKALCVWNVRSIGDYLFSPEYDICLNVYTGKVMSLKPSTPFSYRLHGTLRGNTFMSIQVYHDKQFKRSSLGAWDLKTGKSFFHELPVNCFAALKEHHIFVLSETGPEVFSFPPSDDLPYKVEEAQKN